MQIEPQIMEFFQGEQEVFYSPHSPHEPRDGKLSPRITTTFPSQLKTRLTKFPESQFSSLAPQPDSYLQVDPMDVAMHPQEPPKAISPRPRMSEEEYAALTVLNDEELLTIYALKSGQVSCFSPPCLITTQIRKLTLPDNPPNPPPLPSKAPLRRRPSSRGRDVRRALRSPSRQGASSARSKQGRFWPWSAREGARLEQRAGVSGAGILEGDC